MSGEAKKRVLRLGIIQGGKIVEERLLRKRESITIGRGARNTFIIPIPQLPGTYTLFETTGAGYQLLFEEKMEGRVSFGDEIIDLRAAAQAGQMKKRGGLYVLPLPDNSRGKVVIGDVTILFQFVDAPPVMPRAQLPAAARGRSIDWTFAYILMISFILQGGFGGGLMVYWVYDGQYRVDPLQAKKERRYALLEELKLKAEKKKKEEEKKEEEKKEDEDKVEDQPAPKPKKKKKPKARKFKKKRTVARKKTKTGKTDRKALRAKLRKSTAVGMLLSAGGDKKSAFSKAMAAARASDDESALAGAGAIRVEGSDKAGGTFRGANKLGKKTGELKRGKKGSKSIALNKTRRTTKGPETRPKVRPGRVSGKSGLGKINGRAVQRVFSRRRSAIRTCYEKGLKVNPKLRGKVKIRFTIGTAGRVTSIRVVSNGTGNSTVANCIKSKIKRWRFPKPEGGVATFTNSFLLTR